MEKFIAYILVCIAMYLIPSGIGAFVQLDWTYLDFTTWQKDARIVYGVAWILCTIYFLYDGIGD